MDLKNTLIKNNISYTKQRQIIYDEIIRLHHFSYEDLEKSLKKIWRASIFRTLNLFSKIWIINIVETVPWVLTYELIDEKNHHEHMRCQKCGKIYEFDDNELHDLFIKIANKHGFVLVSHSLIFKWICKECNTIWTKI